jgi:hypothetical protein
MKQIKLTKNQVTFVDDEDYNFLMQWKWHAKPNMNNGYYAIRGFKNEKNTMSKIHMHRVIMNLTDPNLVVDHIDGNPLNNQKSNLRICTKDQNRHNRKASKSKKSKYLGVFWNKECNKWYSQIKDGKKIIYLGIHNTEEEAAMAYDEASKKKYGEYAYLNF